MTNVLATTEDADGDYVSGPTDTSQWSGEADTSTRWRWISDPSSNTPIIVGVAIVIVGFALMVIGWSSVAGTADVWKQFPYLLSAGLPGVGLIMVGLVLVNVTVRRQDGALRAHQIDSLRDALRDLQQSLDRK